MAANSGFRLFSSSGDFANFGFGFAGDSPQEAALHLPPPSVKVLPSEVPENVKYMAEPVNLGELTLLKLGCGHGLPVIFACLEIEIYVSLVVTGKTSIKFFHKLKIKEVPNGDNGSASGAYDVILMPETVYSISSLQNLYELVKKCMSRPHGVAYVAGKKHYFGVGGETRRFLSLVEKDGIMASSIVAEVADGSSNLLWLEEARPVSTAWKTAWKTSSLGEVRPRPATTTAMPLWREVWPRPAAAAPVARSLLGN